MRRALRIGLISLALTVTPAALMAQDRATLLSDRLELGADSRLIATGNVEIFYQGRKLTARQLVFDQLADHVSIEGPLLLSEKDGRTTILADQAELSGDMSEGILTSARIVMQEQMQLAANRITRNEGRFSTMEDVVASSCKICAQRPVPLWEIRAKRVTHDQLERQIYFDHARLLVRGVPLAYFPYFRLPDPSLDRSAGFLAPKLRTTSNLGYGVKIPYFIPLGDSRDLTVTPYLSSRDSQTLQLRYRQAFANGGISLEGHYTRDRLVQRPDRGFIRADGAFALPEDVDLTFSLKSTSDNAYLVDYGISNDDRLDSRVELTRVRRNGFFSARVISFQSLRDEDDNDTLPSLVTDGTFHRRFSLGPLGGEGGFRLQSHSHLRTSSNPLDGPDPDTIADGRDMSRVSARIDWRRAFILPMGIEAVALGEAKLDYFRIRQDAQYDGNHTRGHTAAGIELRWPWVKASGSGASHVLEPVVQLIAANRHHADRPIEDAWLVDFDEGNLLSLDRFPGGDSVEEGARANIGLSWTRYDPAGWSTGVTLGRLIRDGNPRQFGANTGLANQKSDWLTTVSYESANGFLALGRAVYDNEFSIAKAEVLLSQANDWLSFTGGLQWFKDEPTQDRYTPTRVGKFDALWHINEDFAAKVEASYDFEARQATYAGLGLEYRNECILVDFGVTRRFTSSDSIKPVTDIGLSVDLLGIGGRKGKAAAKRCY